MRNLIKLGAAALAACALCCAPLVVPFGVGLAGVAVSGTGYGALGEGVVLGAIMIFVWRRKSGCGCPAASRCAGRDAC